jgi:hypothetical protein
VQVFEQYAERVHLYIPFLYGRPWRRGDESGGVVNDFIEVGEVEEVINHFERERERERVGTPGVAAERQTAVNKPPDVMPVATSMVA